MKVIIIGGSAGSFNVIASILKGLNKEVKNLYSNYYIT
jgi:hypothetical protein